MLKTLVVSLSLMALVGIAFVSADDKDVTITRDAITGKIVSVEMDKKTITLLDPTTNKNVVNDATTFYKDGKSIEVKTLVPNDEVTLKLVPNEKNIILRLDTPIVVTKEE